MDIRTILFCLFLINLLMGVFMYVAKETQKLFAGINYWIISNLLISAGYLLLSLRHDSGDSLLIIFSQLFFIAAGMLRITGTRIFFNYKRKFSGTLAAIIITISLAQTLYFTLVRDSIMIRTVVLGIILSGFSLYNGILIQQNKPQKDSGVYLVTYLSFYLFSAIFIARIIIWFIDTSDRGLFNAAFINSLQFLSSMIIDILWSVMFFVMQNQRLNQQLMNREKELSDLNIGKDRFISVLAHDLKNIFNSLLNIFELMNLKKGKITREETDYYVQNLYSCTLKGYDTFEDLLLWSVSNLQKTVPDLKKLELIEQIRIIVDKIQNSDDSKNISIVTGVPDNPLFVLADKTMLHSVLRNLISNAMKFSYQNSTVEVLANVQHDTVIVSVRDNGIGIPGHRLDKLFRLSESITTPGTEQEQGTGLGLILCKELIEKMGGKIWVESNLEKGSTFFFTLQQDQKD